MVSEFGRGLVVCLVKFAMHLDNKYARQIANVNHFFTTYKGDMNQLSKLDRSARRDIEDFVNTELALEGNYDKALSHLIELWASGASDHLSEIEVPEKWKELEVGKKVLELKAKASEMGHGFTGKTWTYEDFISLHKLTEEIALLIDLRLGLKDADPGKY